MQLAFKLASGMLAAHAPSPLLTLPNELQLAIVQYLGQPQDVLSLGRTCRELHSIAVSDDVWRARVEAIVRRHARSSTHIPPSWNPGSDIYATLVDHLLGEGAKYLGKKAQQDALFPSADRIVLFAYSQAGGLAPKHTAADCCVSLYRSATILPLPR